RPLRQPPPGQHRPALVHHLHIAHDPQPSHPPRTAASTLRSPKPNTASSQREKHQRPNRTVLTRTRGTTSQQRSALPDTGKGTIYVKGSKPRLTECSPAGGHQAPSLPHRQ